MFCFNSIAHLDHDVLLSKRLLYEKKTVVAVVQGNLIMNKTLLVDGLKLFAIAKGANLQFSSIRWGTKNLRELRFYRFVLLKIFMKSTINKLYFTRENIFCQCP